jgi:hypothetical protein
MIRLVGAMRFREGTTEADIEAFTEAFRALRVEGMVSRSVNRGLALRAKDSHLMVTADFEDEAAFRRYDTDDAHNELRAGVAGRIIESGHTCLYSI